VVLPRLSELRSEADTGEARERSYMLHVDLETVSQTTAHVRRGSRDEILDCEHRQRSRLLIQHACPRESRSERPEQINPEGVLAVDKLKQRLAFGRVRVNVIQQKSIGECSGNRLEIRDDEIEVIQCAPVEGTIKDTQLRCHGETTREGAGMKATRQKLFHYMRGALRIGGLEERGKHGQ
jgi:hypothetical protein